MGSVYIHIGARGGSKQIKNKNLLKLNNKSLIGIAINQARLAKKNCKVVVSSDSKKILKVAENYRADILIKRPKNLSKSYISKFLVWKHSANFLKKHYSLSKNDLFLDIDCTSPLKRVIDIKKMINDYFSYIDKNQKFDALITVTKAKKNPYFNLLELNKKNFLEISKKSPNEVIARQKAPPVFEHVAGFYALKPNFLIKKKSLLSGNIIAFEIDQISAIDIDTINDYKIIKLLSKKNNI